MRNLFAIVSLFAIAAATACSSSSNPKTNTLPDSGAIADGAVGGSKAADAKVDVPLAPDSAGGAGGAGGATQMGTGGASSLDARVATGGVAGGDGPAALDGSSVADVPIAIGDGAGSDAPAALDGSSVSDGLVTTDGADADDASGATGGHDGGGIVDAGGAAGGAGTGGSTGTGGATGTGGGSGSCSFPSCYIDLLSTCVPSGTCVQQTTTTYAPVMMTSNMCYSNGVKVLMNVNMTDPSSASSVTTVTKNGTTCYSYETPFSAGSGSSATVVYKNVAGATVVTIAINATAKTETITCAGGSPVVVSLDACGSSVDGGSSTDGGAGCTTGTCAP
jgi:hypothetical protein